MRVLLVEAYPGYRGAQRSLEALLDGLRRRAAVSRTVASREKGTSADSADPTQPTIPQPPEEEIQEGLEVEILCTSPGRAHDAFRQAHPNVHLLLPPAPLRLFGGSLAKGRLGRRLAAMVALLPYTWTLRGFLRRHRPDIVHCNQARGVLLVALAARSLGLPMVWHQRGMVDLPPMATRLAGLASQHILCVSDAVRRSLPEDLARRATVVANGIDVPIEVPQKSALRQHLGIDTELANRCLAPNSPPDAQLANRCLAPFSPPGAQGSDRCLAPNSPDFQSSESEPANRCLAPDSQGSDRCLAPNPLVLITASSFLPYKGLHHVVDALGRIATRAPEVAAKLLWVVLGDDDGQAVKRSYRQQVQASIEALGMTRRVWWAGWQPNAGEWIAAADLCLLPTVSDELWTDADGRSHHLRCGEGFPRTVLEAMAMGTAVIACDVAAVNEQIVDGDSGFIIPPGDADALAAAIIALARDAPRRERLAAAGHIRVRRFSIEAMTEQTVTFWQSCLGKPLDGRRGQRSSGAGPSQGNNT